MRDIGRSRSHYRTVLHSGGGHTRYLVTFEHWCQVRRDNRTGRWRVYCQRPYCGYYGVVTDGRWKSTFHKALEHARGNASAQVVEHKELA
jgi:hypothetical protein